MCLESLNRIYTITSVPIVDCFQKIRQQIKCYVQLSTSTNKNELQEGLEVINSTNVKCFPKEMTAEFYALKGLLYQLSSTLSSLFCFSLYFLFFYSDKLDDANKNFSAAVQMHDQSVKAWALYGDYLDQVFTRDSRQIYLGVNAIACYLHACRHNNESKARKYLAKVLWLLSYDDDKSRLVLFLRNKRTTT